MQTTRVLPLPPPLPPPPPPDPDKQAANIVALSVTHLCGSTVAIYKRDRQARKWRTIGNNLIAYWADVDASIGLCLDAIADQFSDESYVRFHDLYDINWKSVLDHCSSLTTTVNIRDRLIVEEDVFDLLTIEFSSEGVKLVSSKEVSTAIGIGAPIALDVLDKFSCIISCPLFDKDDKLREHIVSKALHDAVYQNQWDEFEGFCEVLRGSPTQRWEKLRITSMTDLVKVYFHQPTQPLANYSEWSHVYTTYETHEDASSSDKDAVKPKNARSGLVVMTRTIDF